MKYRIHHIMSFIIISTVIHGCIDEISLKSETQFDSALVIEAIITNESKQQEIKLSRAYRLESSGPTPESGAMVRLVGDNGEEQIFSESITPGLYISNNIFAAGPSIAYTLEITTLDGSTYGSEEETLTPIVPIDDLYAQRSFDENGTEGVSIFLDASGSSSGDVYYRYEYEETYKVIAPLYSPQELIVLNDDFDYPQGFFAGYTLQEIIDFFFERRTRPEQEQICYNTVSSNSIILADTDNLTGDSLDSFRIRFMGRNNYIISHRYSILVRQFIQNLAGHTYYKTLNEFSSSENIFSENQLGFLQGNIFSLNNEEEKVIGFFEVSSVNEQRIYFNYDDLFPGEQLPPYVVQCDDFIEPILLKEDFVHNIIGSPVIDALRGGFVYYDLTNDTNPSPFSVRPFSLVLQVCGDCTVLGENVVPEFWEE